MKILRTIKMISALFRGIALIFTFILSNQAQNLHQWGNIGLFHGLPSEKVNGVVQTHDGLFWFATENGLAKFDGRQVQTIPLEGVTQIRVLAVSSDGTLYIGTQAGLFVLQNDKFSLIKETKDQSIAAISVDGGILFAAETGEICQLETGNVTFLVKVDVPIHSILQKRGEVYLGTEGRGLLVLTDGELKAVPNRFQGYFINDLVLNRDSSILIGSRAKSNESGLSEVNNGVIGSQIGSVSSLMFDSKGRLWIGTAGKGVFLFRNNVEIAHYTFENTAGGLPSNQISSVFIDKEDVVWFATDKGVSRFDSQSPFNYVFSDEAGGRFVRVLFQSETGQVYAGTNHGLYIFDGEKWSEDENFSQKSIYSIAESAEKKLIVGTAADNIRDVEVFRGKTYQAIFGKGLYENGTLIFAHNEITALFVDNANLLIGTTKDGLYSFDGKQVIKLNELVGSAIWQIELDRNYALWVATEKGLYLQQNNDFSLILSGFSVRSLLLKRQTILAGTEQNGLFIGKYDENFGFIFSKINVEHGLPAAGVFAIIDRNDEILVGTNRGVSRFVLDEVSPNIIPAKIVSERVHSAQEISSRIALDYPQNTLAIEVTALSSRTYPENFQYAYLLKKGNGDEIVKKLTKDSQIVFESLPPDNYTAEIWTYNQNLVASPPLKIDFSVSKAPFPWTSTALAVLLLIAVLALVWAIIEQRQVARKNVEIAAARFDLANEAERERRRIARDLHDQTLADLRKLMLKSDNLPSETGEFRGEIEAVSDEIRRICEDLSPSVLENVGLTAALEFLLSTTFENYHFECADGLEERLKMPANAQMQIYRIAQEVLNNIKRHAESSTVKMSLSDGDRFKLQIENDGKHFTPDFENLPNGRGISNIKSRAELIAATVSWEISDDAMTSFTFRK